MVDFYTGLESGSLHLIGLFHGLNPVWQSIVVTGLATICLWLIPNFSRFIGLRVGEGSARLQPMRAVTYGLAHADVSHFIGNASWLLATGGRVVGALGASGYLMLYAAGLVGTGLIAPFIDRGREARQVVGASCGVCAVIAAAAVLRGPAPLMSVHGVNVTPLGLVYACIGLSVVRHLATRDRVYHLGHAIGFVIGLCLVDWMH